MGSDRAVRRPECVGAARGRESLGEGWHIEAESVHRRALVRTAQPGHDAGPGKELAGIDPDRSTSRARAGLARRAHHAFARREQIDPQLVELARGADLLVHDAQYTAEELQKRRGWGHSSFDQAMQLAEMAGVKRLALTHHDPEHDDEFLERIEKLCQERFPNAVLAREGMEIPI